jgi:hypothetical protein
LSIAARFAALRKTLMDQSEAAPDKSGQINDLSVGRDDSTPRRTGLKGIPFTASGIPFTTKGIPFTTKGIPFTTKGIPFTTKGIPFMTKGIPFMTV